MAGRSLREGTFRAEGFKGFFSPGSLELAPLTLLVGPNAGGKSSLAQAFMLMVQTVWRNREANWSPWEADRAASVVMNGHLVTLPSFHETVSGHAAGRSMRFQYSAPLGERATTFEVRPSGAGDAYLHRVEWDAEVQRKGMEPRVRVCVVAEMDPRWTDRRRRDDDGLWEDWFRDHPRDDLEAAYAFSLMRGMEASEKAKYLIDEESTRRIWEAAERAGWDPAWGHPTFEPIDPRQAWGASRIRLVRGRSDKPDGKDATVDITGPGAGFGMPAAHVRPSDGEPRSIQDLASRLRTEEARALVNWALHDDLHLPYRVEVERRESKETGPRAAALDATYELVFIDTRTDTAVTAEGIGRGVTQALAVVTAVVDESVELVFLEEPEAHAHPRLQADIGQFLLKQSKTKLLIVETHSELLIRRVQRLIREEMTYPNPTGYTTHKARPEHVSVVYVDSTDELGCTAHRLRLDESGYFVDAWPSGFFEERIRER